MASPSQGRATADTNLVEPHQPATTPHPSPAIHARPHDQTPPITERPNYAYWQTHGSEWDGEYDRRKKRNVFYHVQEIFVTSFVAARAPCTVLELGPGTGRHLQCLSRIPGVEAFGYEQSESMAAASARWADPDWLRDHVRVGPAGAALPWGDASFDAAFTVECLMFTHPDEIDAVLDELLRVCRGPILHIEPVGDGRPLFEAHGGSWAHDLPALYRRRGVEVRVDEPLFAAHRVVIARVAPRDDLASGHPVSRADFEASDAVADLYRRMVADLMEGVNRSDASIERTRRELDQLAARYARAQAQLADAAVRDAEHEQERSDLFVQAMRIQASLDSSAAERAELERQLAAFAPESTRLSDAEARAAALEQQLAAQAALVAQLSDARAQDAQAHAAQLAEQARQADARAAELSREIDRLREVERSLARLDQLEREVISLRAALGRQARVYQDQIAALQTQSAAHATHSAALAAQRDAFVAAVNRALDRR